MPDILKMDASTWSTTTTHTQTGSSDTDNLVNDVVTTINSLFGALNTISFMENTKNFITVLEDFGNGLNAALACVSLDLQFVTNGLSVAVAALGATDPALANTFASLEAQMGYYTHTALAPGVASLATPSAAAQASLNSLSLPSSQSFWDTTAGQVVIGAGIVLAVAVVVVVVAITLPVDAIVAAGTAVVSAGAAFFSWALSW